MAKQNFLVTYTLWDGDEQIGGKRKKIVSDENATHAFAWVHAWARHLGLLAKMVTSVETTEIPVRLKPLRIEDEAAAKARADAKAAKLKEREDAKAANAKKREDAKAAKLKEREDAKAAKEKEKAEKEKQKAAEAAKKVKEKEAAEKQKAKEKADAEKAAKAAAKSKGKVLSDE